MESLVFQGRFYYKGKFQELSVSVENGVIRKIGKDMRSNRTVRLEGGIFPGSTDIHVHFRDPGETDMEDFFTGSMSAVFGGTTTVFDMPNNRVPVTDYEVFEQKLSAVRKRSFCDYGLYSMFTGNNSEIISRKSSGIKTYMGGSTNAEPGLLNYDSIGQLSIHNVPKVFHAESAECLKTNAISEVSGLAEHDMSRPLDCELESLRKLSGFKLGRMVAAHVTSSESLKVVGKTALKEATPHHLLLNLKNAEGPWAKVNPPIRSSPVQEGLLTSFLDGEVDIVSSDHAPHLESEKEEMAYAKSGMIGVETRIPLMLGLVRKKILPLDLFYRTCIENPARAFGLHKGEIAVGNFADFFTVDLSEMETLKESMLHSKVPITPFDGFQAIFPTTVVMRGEMIIERREIISDPSGEHVMGNVR